MVFDQITNTVYDKSSAVLMDKKRLAMVADGMYVSLDFDSNQAGAMKAAMVDLYTANATQQLKGFVESPNFTDIFPDADTRDVAMRRIKQYVLAKRARRHYEPNEIQNIRNGLEVLVRIGARQSLAGVSQIVKQTVPIMTNTMLNTGGEFRIDEYSKQEARDFVNNSGRTIAIRGAASSIPIETMDKLMEKTSKSKTWIQKFEKLQEVQMETLLVKPDVTFAQASWLTYYMHDLKKQGIDTKNIDWATHKLNNTAADWADDMVGLQQNVSDADMLGNWFNPSIDRTWMVRNITLAFASFTTNMKARIS